MLEQRQPMRLLAETKETKMSKETITLNTVEDMVAFVTKNLYNADRKWMLQDHKDWQWDDPEAGKAWQAEDNVNEFVSMFDENKKAEYASYLAKEKELDARKPKQHQETSWSLRESGEGWHNAYINLSPELGEMLDKTWKTKPAYKGADYTSRTGYVTIPGMLKRLGMIGFDKQIKADKEAEEARRAKNGRNYERKEVMELANKIATVMEKYPNAFVNLDTDLISLINLRNLKLED